MKNTLLYIFTILLFYGCNKEDSIINQNDLELSFLVVGETGEAFCNYVNIEPDLELNVSGTLYIWDSMDINFDNKIDYKIYLAQSVDPHIGEGWSAKIKTIGKNEIAVSNVSYLPSVFEMGDTLNNKLNWISSQGSYLTICGSGNPKTGEWDETDDGYLGCRIINDLDTQYCWIQMSLSTGLERSWIIKDYAYTK